MSKRVAACSLLVVAGVALAEPAHAGFLDNLARAVFGAPPARFVVPEAPLPLEMTVRPQRRKQPKAASASKPVTPAIKVDPATEPYWYLRDPTLRRGDIVVTQTGALVFEGPRETEHAAADFVVLERSRLVPKSFKQRVAASVAATPGIDANALASTGDRIGD